MASSDEDEDLKRAIELSLQDHNSEPKRENQQAANVACSNGEVIDLDSDEDAKCAAKSRKASPSPLASSNSSYICNNFLGLNRKAMEQERLARKRKTPISPPPLRKSVKLDIGGSPLNVPVALMTNDSARLLALPKMKVERKCAQPNFMPTTSSAPMYLDGAVKKTWARGYDRSEDVKMEELLQREDLTLAVISSFQWEIDWLFSKLDTKSTQLTLIMHAKEESTRRQYQEETSAMRNLRLCFPPMEGNVQCMHSKFMLLGHSSFLRMVITTANMTPHDWGETSVMENMVFVIDLPKLPADHERLTIDQMTFFGKELLYFFEAMGLDGKIIQSILRFDFSRTKDLAFVHSIGGVHAGEKDPWRRTGYCGLGTAIRELGLMSERDITIDYVTSSMGSLNIEFLTKLYVAAQGDDGLAEYDVRYAAAKVKQNKGDETQQAQFKALETVRKTARDNFRVYFPTQETVLASNGGVAAGGTICFNRKCFDYPEFPRGVLRDCWSRRTGLLMHNKLIYVRPLEQHGLNSSSSTQAWAYIGSANCSESAWGIMTKDRVSKGPRLTCRNWECGVVIPMPNTNTKRKISTASSSEEMLGNNNNNMIEIFEEGHFPIPMVTPGKKYGHKKPYSSQGHLATDSLHPVFSSSDEDGEE